MSVFIFGISTYPGLGNHTTLEEPPQALSGKALGSSADVHLCDLVGQIQNIDKIFTLIPTYPSTLKRSTVGLPRILGVAPT